MFDGERLIQNYGLNLLGHVYIYDKKQVDFQDIQMIYSNFFVVIYQIQIKFDEVKCSMNCFDNRLKLMMNMYLI